MSKSLVSCLDTVVQVTSHHETGYFQRLNERLDENVSGDFIEVVAGHVLIEISWHTYFFRKKYYRAQNCAGESSAQKGMGREKITWITWAIG